MNYQCGYMVILTNSETTPIGLNLTNYCEQLFSISEFCSVVIPDSKGISSQSMKYFEFDSNVKTELNDYIAKLYKDKEVIWPDIFSSLQSAKIFKEKFFSNRADVYILSIGLPAEFYQDFLENQKPEDNHYPYIYDNLKMGIKLNDKMGEFLGYDICGYNGKSPAPCFYSYLCNKLHIEFINLGININKKMLISTFSDAKKAINLIDDEQVLADSDYLWYPWAIYNVTES
jgi:hypothetical protein